MDRLAMTMGCFPVYIFGRSFRRLRRAASRWQSSTWADGSAPSDDITGASVRIAISAALAMARVLMGLLHIDPC